MHYLERELRDLLRDDPRIFDFLEGGSLDGMCLWNAELPEEEWISPRFWQVLGYDPDSKEHRTAERQDLTHPDDREAPDLADHSESDEPHDRVVRYRHSDGSTVWARQRSIAIRDADGRLVRVLGTHTALTEHVILTRPQRTTIEELHRFAATAAHDLKAPIRQIQLLGEMARSDLEQGDQDSALELLGRLRGRAVFASDLIDALLAYACADREFDLALVSLTAIVEQLATVHKSTLRNTGGELSVEGALPAVLGDEAGITQLLTNLVDNALRYTRENTPPRVSVSCTEDTEDWHIHISDNGCGIPPEYRDTVFLPFKRLHGAEVAGTGLGLASCARIVEMHGGWISFESEVGRGTCFTVHLPRTAASQRARINRTKGSPRLAGERPLSRRHPAAK